MGIGLLMSGELEFRACPILYSLVSSDFSCARRTGARVLLR